MFKIGVILPTRGMVFTEVEEALSRELLGREYKIYRSHNLVIPDGHNNLVEQALEDDCENLLFVEEDTVIPIGGINEMMLANSDIACIDYAVAGWSCITRDKSTNEILWCGLGCTLIRRHVFEALEKPYFRSDKALLLNCWPEIKWIDPGAQAYGGQDIWFFMKAREKGFRITQVEGECRHLKLESLGRAEINKGLHTIIQKPTIINRQTL